jgi:acetyltransferase-like isoleucine patch superfamily enzyme
MSNTKVGKFCSIGPNVLCVPEKHPSNTFVSTHPIFFSTLKQTQITFADKNYYQEVEAVKIGNDVWVGANAIILGGLEIGDGAIIAAGAVVTKNILPYAIVGGAPAKLIRYRFHKNEIDFLSKLKWWDKDIDWLKNNYKLFHDISSLIELPLCDSSPQKNL